MTALASVWQQVKWLLYQKVSIIPVRDKDDLTGAYPKVAKSAYSEWKQYQKEIITEEFLFHEMERHNTTAVAIIGGVVSGNLEIIDVDVKYYPGLEAILVSDIRLLHPELFPKLRIHKTPSGGIHIIYRCEVPVPGSRKISGRPATDEELQLKPGEKVKYYIETKAEGGYAVAPPSLGYSIIQDVPIPVITADERMSLMAICETYNQYRKEPKPYKPTRTQSDYYDENPFFHYSRTADPVQLLESHGWSFLSKQSRGNFLYFTRPGKTAGVSASFNQEKRILWVFTSNSVLEPKGYFLANVLAALQFGDDMQKTYYWLTKNGYGKIKPEVEAKQAKVKAATGSSLPANFSDEAKAGYDEYVRVESERHPHGIFWDIDEEDTITINRERLYAVSADLGYRWHRDECVQIVAPFIHKRSFRDYYDQLRSYIRIEDADIYTDVRNTFDIFLQHNSDHILSHMPLIPDDRILRDGRNVAYKFFSDCYVRVTAVSVDQVPYSLAPGLIYAERIQPRPYRIGSGGKYIEFLRLACELDKNRDYLRKIIGYYSHEYNDETLGYFVICTEQCEDPKDGGGSGKNAFCNLLALTTTLTKKPGSQTKLDEKTFQTWNGERVFAVHDLPRDFDMSFFKDISTGGFVWKKLHINERIVGISDSPKLIFTTNYSYSCTDGGLLRRIIPLEFTNFFSRYRSIRDHFGVQFPVDWNDEDWAGFDGFVITALQTWLASGLKMEATPLSESGWRKQFEINCGKITTGFIYRYWEDWHRIGFVTNEGFKTMLNLYCNEGNVPGNRVPSTGTVTKAIEMYAAHQGTIFNGNYQNRELPFAPYGRLFKLNDDPPF